MGSDDSGCVFPAYTILHTQNASNRGTVAYGVPCTTYHKFATSVVDHRVLWDARPRGLVFLKEAEGRRVFCFIIVFFSSLPYLPLR